MRFFIVTIFSVIVAACSKDNSLGNEMKTIQFSSIEPTQGPAGQIVVIEGEGFGDYLEDNDLKFNGKSAKIITASTSRLVVVVPEGSITGPITLKVGSRNAVSEMDFEVITSSTTSL